LPNQLAGPLAQSRLPQLRRREELVDADATVASTEFPLLEKARYRRFKSERKWSGSRQNGLTLWELLYKRVRGPFIKFAECIVKKQQRP
jgi:hypothetical protein